MSEGYGLRGHISLSLFAFCKYIGGGFMRRVMGDGWKGGWMREGICLRGVHLNEGLV